MAKLIIPKRFLVESDKRLLKSLLKGLIGLTVLLIVLGIILEVVGVGGNYRFYKKWVECGQKPVMLNPKREIKYKGKFMDYGEAPTINLFRVNVTLFCTSLEAEKAGYSASPDRYVFPQLEAERKSRQ